MKKKDGLGMVHLYCGDGKGKTTAAIGLAIRAAGCGFEVKMLQFLKDGTSGEVKVLQKVPGIDLQHAGIKTFTVNMTPEEKDRAKKRHRFLLQNAMQQQEGLLILDEILGAVESGTLDKEDLLWCLQKKSPDLELVLTGRKRIKEIENYVDYLSEIHPVKHPYEKGIPARKGIEF